jgi:hypothetical protein
VLLLAVVFVLMWAGSALLIDSWLRCRSRPTLEERLAPFRATVVDEAEFWLRRQP